MAYTSGHLQCHLVARNKGTPSRAPWITIQIMISYHTLKFPTLHMAGRRKIPFYGRPQRSCGFHIQVAALGGLRAQRRFHRSVGLLSLLVPSCLLCQLFGLFVMTLMEPVKSADTMISLSSVSSSIANVAEFSARAMRKMKDGFGAKTAAVTTALCTRNKTEF